MKKIGNSTPRFMTGINLDAAYKGWDLQMFWQGVLKRDWWPGDKNMTFWGVTDGEWWSTSFKRASRLLPYIRKSTGRESEFLLPTTDFLIQKTTKARPAICRMQPTCV